MESSLLQQLERARAQLKLATDNPETGTKESLSDWLQLVSVSDGELKSERVAQKLKAVCEHNGFNRLTTVDGGKRFHAPLLIMVQFAGAEGQGKEKVRWVPMVIYRLGIAEDGKRLKKTPSKRDDVGPHFVFVVGVDFHGIGDDKASWLGVWLKNTTSLSDLSNDPHIRKQRQQPKNWRIVNPQSGLSFPFFDVIGATSNTWLSKIDFCPADMQRTGPPLLVPQLKTSIDKRKGKLTPLDIEWGEVPAPPATSPEQLPKHQEVKKPEEEKPEEEGKKTEEGKKKRSRGPAKQSPAKRQQLKKPTGDGSPKKKRGGRPSKQEAAKILSEAFECNFTDFNPDLNSTDFDATLIDFSKLDEPMNPEILLELPIIV